MRIFLNESARPARAAALAGYAIGLGVATALLALAPGSGSAMLAVPLGGTTAAGLLREDGVRLLREGPVPGSLILVVPDGPPLQQALAQGILLVRAYPGLCGDKRNAI